jgi:hypothetical protein
MATVRITAFSDRSGMADLGLFPGEYHTHACGADSNRKSEKVHLLFHGTYRDKIVRLFNDHFGVCSAKTPECVGLHDLFFGHVLFTYWIRGVYAFKTFSEINSIGPQRSFVGINFTLTEILKKRLDFF